MKNSALRDGLNSQQAIVVVLLLLVVVLLVVFCRLFEAGDAAAFYVKGQRECTTERSGKKRAKLCRPNA